MATSTPAASMDIITLLEAMRSDGVRMSNAEEVHQYLTRFPTMVDSVARAVGAVRAEFTGDFEFSLGVYVDPEIEDYEQVLLLVRTHDYSDEFFDRLMGLTIEVTRSLLGEAGDMLVTTDYYSPGEVP